MVNETGFLAGAVFLKVVDADAHVFQGADFAEAFGFETESLIEEHLGSFANRFLEHRVNGLGQVADIDIGELVGHVDWVFSYRLELCFAIGGVACECGGGSDQVALDLFADQAELQGFGTRDSAAGAQYGPRVVEPYQPRKPLSRTGAWNDAEIRLGFRGKRGKTFASEAGVTSHAELVAAAESKSVIGADDRLREVLDRQENEL